MTAPRPTEDELIARWFRPLATDPAAFGLGDDCAALTPPPGHDIVLKTDAVAAGIHFFPDDPWDAIARKALRVNLSDLAAKGARPLGYLLSLALPADWRVEDLEAFAAGLAADQARYGVSLLGGDTIRAPSGLVVSVTVLGAVPTGRMARRGGATAGDRLYVSGTLGDAALGLALRLDPNLADAWGLDAGDREHLLARYLLPEPRPALAPAVLAHAGAAMDVSDGLALDLNRMTREARLSAVVEVERVPLSGAAAAVVARDPARIRDVLTGGDDYEILAAVPPARAQAFERAAAEAEVAVTRIGEIRAAPGAPTFVGSDGVPLSLDRSGFRHF
jgi:thiamine-monophosphate kinase